MDEGERVERTSNVLLVGAVALLAVLVAATAVGLVADVVEPRDAAWILMVAGLPLGIVGGIAGWVRAGR